MLTVSHNVSIINDLQRDKVHKKLNDVLDQNVDATKRNQYRRQFILTAAV